MTLVEQYKQHGLRPPITVKAGFAYHALLWGGGGFLVLGCLAALASNEPHIQFVGAFGILFFGAAL